MMRQSEFKKKYDPDTGKFSSKTTYLWRRNNGYSKILFGKKPTQRKKPPPKPTVQLRK